MAGGEERRRHESTSRRTRSVSAQEVIEATAANHGVDASGYAAFRSSAAGRDMAAWLCRRWTGETLAQLGPHFGLSGTDSVSNLVRRAQRRHDESTRWHQRAVDIEKALKLKTENKV